MYTKIHRVIAAVSGGVDSSVAALLLKKKGFEVCGVHMKNWDDQDESGQCSGASDAEDAEWVCKQLGIQFLHTNFVKEYWNDVFSDLLTDYTSGLTPNPDILCNKHIKFNYFHKYAVSNLGADAIATGHYARSSYGDLLQHRLCNSDVRLLQAKDRIKDQTFFLSQVSQAALQKAMFPIGNLTKQEVRDIAEQRGLTRIAKKKESMGICFIGLRNFQHFISQYIVPNPGSFIDIENGKIVGKHDGIHNWTVGQRCRLSGLREPYYIVRKDQTSQNILVAPGTDHPSLYTRLFFTSSPHWIHPSTIHLMKDNTVDCSFRFQNTHVLTKCKITQQSVTNNLVVYLDNYLRAITPGQFAVFYKGDECLGSARIQDLGASLYELGMDVNNASAIPEIKMKQ